MVNYTYNAWGEIVSISGTMADTIGQVNKLRYRSYYYDTETGFYYLQSRYYDPIVKRFISPDSTDYLTENGSFDGYNLYAYCVNNPVMNSDLGGNAPINVICAAIGALVGLPFGKYVANQLGYKKGLKYNLIRAGVVVGGAVIGWFAGACISKIVGNYLLKDPKTILRLSDKLGAKKMVNLLNFFGINPISALENKSIFAGFFKVVFDSPKVTIPTAWISQVLTKAKQYGLTIRLDSGHSDSTPWNFTHLHIGNTHIAIAKDAINIIKKFLGM